MALQYTDTEFKKGLTDKKIAWWMMMLPSGEVRFSDAKAKMLGYPPTKFKKYQDFTALVHPEDVENAMTAMRDHISNKTDVYITCYRIKTKKGVYREFYDYGKITSRDGENITAMGFVFGLDEGKEDEQIQAFKTFMEGCSVEELVTSLQ
jgi:PAS domain-containing protein